MAIDEPCLPGMGFSTCPTFGEGQLTRTPRTLRAPRGACIRCHDEIPYDYNRVRQVLKTTNGWKWGEGPARDDAGIEFKCVVQ